MKNKTFKAWARKSGSNDQFCTTQIRSTSKKAAKAWFDENGFELLEPVYQS